MSTSPYHLVARVTREIVRREPDPHIELGALADAVKCACARYRIPYDTDLVAKAVRSELWKVSGLCGRGRA